MIDVPTPDCPLCGAPPMFAVGAMTQAFCGNEECRVLSWNPRRTKAQNEADSAVIELPAQWSGLGDFAP